MNKTLKKVVLATIVSSALVGCGGDDGGSNDGGNKVKITGKVFNLANTKVFFDANQNMKHDSNEPSTLTNSEGFYSIELPSDLDSCIATAPLIADVNTKSIYIDSQANPIGSYQMFRPAEYSYPDFDFPIVDKNITYFTSMAWMSAPLATDFEGELSDCESDSILAEDDYFEQIKSIAKTKDLMQKELGFNQEELNSVDYTNMQLKSVSDEIESNFISNFAKSKTLPGKVGYLLRDNGKGRYWESYRSEAIEVMSKPIVRKEIVEHTITNSKFDVLTGTVKFKEELAFDSVIDRRSVGMDELELYTGFIWENNTCYQVEMVIEDECKYALNGISNGDTAATCNGDSIESLDFQTNANLRKIGEISFGFNGYGVKKEMGSLSSKGIADQKDPYSTPGLPSSGANYPECNFNYSDLSACGSLVDIYTGKYPTDFSYEEMTSVESIRDAANADVIVTFDINDQGVPSYEILTLQSNGQLK